MPHPYIALVESRAFVAEALREAAGAVAVGIPVACERAGTRALRTLRLDRASLAMVSSALPDMDGLSLVSAIVDERLAGRVIVVCDQRDACIDRFARTVGAGVIDLRHDRARQVRATVAAALAGRSRRPTVWRVPGNEPDIFRVLTPRELQVLAHIGLGEDDRHAAMRLSLSAATVHTHRHNIMRKLRAHTRSELIRVSLVSGAVRIASGATTSPVLACIPSPVLAAAGSSGR